VLVTAAPITSTSSIPIVVIAANQRRTRVAIELTAV
jgi:hypothetical protein